MKYVERAKEIIDIEVAGLQKVGDGLGKEFGRAVDILLSALNEGHKIVVTGVGKNLPIGQKIASTLTSTGSPAVFLHSSVLARTAEDGWDLGKVAEVYLTSTS